MKWSGATVYPWSLRSLLLLSFALWGSQEVCDISELKPSLFRVILPPSYNVQTAARSRRLSVDHVSTQPPGFLQGQSCHKIRKPSHIYVWCHNHVISPACFSAFSVSGNTETSVKSSDNSWRTNRPTQEAAKLSPTSPSMNCWTGDKKRSLQPWNSFLNKRFCLQEYHNKVIIAGFPGGRRRLSCVTKGFPACLTNPP